MTGTASEAPALPKALLQNPRLSTWVSLRPSGRVEVRIGKVELGQGILTAVAQVAADELDVAVGQVTMLPAHTVLGPDQGLTAGSMSVFEAVPAVRQVCAHVRALLLDEAARELGVPVEGLTVRAGTVLDERSGRRTTYGDLAGAVDLDVDVTTDVPVKLLCALGVSGQGVTGQSVARLDLPDKVTGRPRYIADLRLPGQLFGRVVRPSAAGAALDDVDESVVSGLDVRVVRDGSFLGVVAPREEMADRAAELLRSAARWTAGEPLPDEDDLHGFLTTGPHDPIPLLDDDLPPVEGRSLAATYTRPFLAHGSIAPSCGVARWEPDGTLSVWSHSQGIHSLRAAIAAGVEVDVGSVVVEHVESAGCYGHNGADDAAFDAALLARTVPGAPVQVRWSRHDELSWSPCGSAMAVQMQAIVDDDGTIRQWSHDVWSQGHAARPGYGGVPGLLAGAHLATPLPQHEYLDPPLGAGGGTTRNAVPLYEVGSRRVTGHRKRETPVRSSAMRSLGAHMNVFAIESFMDELAETSGSDALEYRLRHLTDERARAVLEKAASAGSWGAPCPDGVGRGIGIARYKDRGAYCAVVAEVEAETEIRVRRLTIAVDVGLVVNPDGVRNQIEGGATQSTSWTLKERVRFDRSRITSVDWETYPILRFSEVPEIDVHLMDRPDLPSVGCGEAAQGPTAAAIANGVTAALGVRVRDLPLTTEAVITAVELAEA
jgi:nicotinate dehydrogenase subunit B